MYPTSLVDVGRLEICVRQLAELLFLHEAEIVLLELNVAGTEAIREVLLSFRNLLPELGRPLGGNVGLPKLLKQGDGFGALILQFCHNRLNQSTGFSVIFDGLSQV